MKYGRICLAPALPRARSRNFSSVERHGHTPMYTMYQISKRASWIRECSKFLSRAKSWFWKRSLLDITTEKSTSALCFTQLRSQQRDVKWKRSGTGLAFASSVARWLGGRAVGWLIGFPRLGDQPSDNRKSGDPHPIRTIFESDLNLDV